MSESRPIFILGCPRSGNTLMACILCRHPAFFIFFERGTFTSLFKKWRERCRSYPSESRAVSFAGTVVAAWENWLNNRTTLSLNYEEIIDYVRQTDGSYGAMVDRLMHLLREKVKPDALHWGDKTPQHVGHMRRIHEAFPRARFIFMRRDPRSVVNSLTKSAFYPASDDALFNTGIVRQYWRRYQEQKKEVPAKRVCEVRYENLVACPEEVLRKVCRFLDVSYDPGLLRQADSSIRKATGWPGYKGWGAIQRQPSQAPSLVEKEVLAALERVGCEMGYDIPRQSPVHRLKATLSIIPYCILRPLLGWAYRQRHPQMDSFFLQRKVTGERLKQWLVGKPDDET